MQTPTLVSASAVPGQGHDVGQASQAGVFGAVMQQPAANAKVYASVYSGVIMLLLIRAVLIGGKGRIELTRLDSCL